MTESHYGREKHPLHGKDLVEDNTQILVSCSLLILDKCHWMGGWELVVGGGKAGGPRLAAALIYALSPMEMINCRGGVGGGGVMPVIDR